MRRNRTSYYLPTTIKEAIVSRSWHTTNWSSSCSAGPDSLVCFDFAPLKVWSMKTSLRLAAPVLSLSVTVPACRKINNKCGQFPIGKGSLPKECVVHANPIPISFQTCTVEPMPCDRRQVRHDSSPERPRK